MGFISQEWLDEFYRKLKQPPKDDMPRRAIRTLSDVPIPEKSIQAAIKDILLIDGWRVFETDAARRHHDTGSVRHPLSEPGMADLLCVRYLGDPDDPHIRDHCFSLVLWIECKRLAGKSTPEQHLWQSYERERGALVVVLGEDCEASIDGWLNWYRGSGLMRRKL